MKIKTSELTDLALDWAVAKCEGLKLGGLPYNPSSNWKYGGPIIEREKLSFAYNDFGQPPEPDKMYIGFVWNGRQHEDLAFGPTPLIAAMRCYVASQLGDEIDVPDELTMLGETKCK